MKKIIAVLLILVMALPATAYAEQNSEFNISEDGYKVLSYNDDGSQILPSQKVIGNTAYISSVVPRKTGKIFCGWRVEGKKDIFKTGQQIEVKDSILLSAVWESGNLPELKLKAESDKDGRVTFSLDFSYGGFMNYAYFEVHTRNLTTAEEDVFEITNGKITVDSLTKGQYKAFLLAKKYDIEYLSNEVNFVVLSGIEAPDAPLKLIMEGKKLVFADEQPQLIDGYTYIAIRQFCESMDARVDWKEEDRSATITLGGTIIKIFENSDECLVNGIVQQLPVKTILKNGRMLLPLRSVAEFCNAEIVWDDNRTVYIYRGAGNAFEENMMFVRTSSEKYLCSDGDEITLSKDANYGCGWIFDAVDGGNGIYVIYNLSDLKRPLQVKDGILLEGNYVTTDSEGEFDGHLWRLNKNSDGTYTFSPANNPELYLNPDTMTLTSDASSYDINYISSLEL